MRFQFTVAKNTIAVFFGKFIFVSVFYSIKFHSNIYKRVIIRNYAYVCLC